RLGLRRSPEAWTPRTRPPHAPIVPRPVRPPVHRRAPARWLREFVRRLQEPGSPRRGRPGRRRPLAHARPPSPLAPAPPPALTDPLRRRRTGRRWPREWRPLGRFRRRRRPGRGLWASFGLEPLVGGSGFRYRLKPGSG